MKDSIIDMLMISFVGLRPEKTNSLISTGTTARVCASSYAICEHQIETEREEMLDTIKDILDNTINWYISWVEERMSSVICLGSHFPVVE